MFLSQDLVSLTSLKSMVGGNVSLDSIDGDDDLASLVADDEISGSSNKKEKRNDLLLTDIIEELGEYDRVRQLFQTQPTHRQPSSPNDVKALYLEDLVKIEERLKDDDQESNYKEITSSSSTYYHKNIYHSNLEHTSNLSVQENQTIPQIDQVMEYANEINSTTTSSLMFDLEIEKVNNASSSANGPSKMETAYVTSESDEEKNGKEIRKMKNNEASKVHRAKKKQKYQNLFQRESELKVKNVGLKLQVETMEKELEYLRELLLVKVAVSSSSKHQQSFGIS